MSVKISASLMCADFWDLSETIRQLEESGVEWIHFDIMDGHFVPNLTMGPIVLESLRPQTKLLFDTHLMIEDPDSYIPQFAEAGADILCVSIETCRHPVRTLNLIEEVGAQPAVALNPATPLEMIEHLLGRVKMVLLMSVEPGFSGQEFIPEVVPKVAALRKMLDERELDVDIEVDGNIGPHTAPQVVEAGATVLVGGSAGVFRSDMRIAESVKALRESIAHLERG